MKHTGFGIVSIAFIHLAVALPARCETARADALTGFNQAKLRLMDEAIANAISAKKLPGGVLWLERQGQVYHQAYGNRALAPAEELMSEDTIFDAASLTKVVACTPA